MLKIKRKRKSEPILKVVLSYETEDDFFLTSAA
jgi:hypothetical protein